MQEADSTIDTAPGQFDAVTFDDITARYRASKEYGPDWAERHAEAVIARVRQACEAKDYAYLHSLPLKFHDQRRSADSSFRVAYDSQAIQAFYSKAIFIFQASFSIISTISVRISCWVSAGPTGKYPSLWRIL